MLYALVIFLIAGSPDGGRAVNTSLSYESLSLCIKAADIVNHMMPTTSDMSWWDHNKPVAICVPYDGRT